MATKQQRMLEAARGQAQSLRRRMRERRERAQHTALATASAGVLGYAERQGWEMPAVGDVDPAVLYGGAALAGSFFSSGRTSDALGAAADGLLSVGAYKLGLGDIG